jgi:hypothetical protein
MRSRQMAFILISHIQHLSNREAALVQVEDSVHVQNNAAKDEVLNDGMSTRF